MRRLDQLAEVGAGNPAPQSATSFVHGTMPFFRTSDVGRLHLGELSDAEDWVNDAGARGMRLHLAGTVLMPKSGASTFTDHRVITTRPGYVSSHLATIKADGRNACDRYLYYALQAVSARDVAGDSSYPTLSLAQVKTIEVPAPPLAEQQRIVAVLDKAFEKIKVAEDRTSASLRSLDQARSAFEAAAFRVGKQAVDRGVRLGDIANFRNGLNYTKSSTGEMVPVVGVADFEDKFSVDAHTLNQARIDGRLDVADELAEGDILTVRSNGSQALIGRTILVGSVPERTGFSGFVIRTRLWSDKVSPEYLCHYLKSPAVRAELVASGAGANISSLSQGALAKLEVPCPPRDEQTRIVLLLDRARLEFADLARAYRKKLELLTELKQSLLTRALSGKLTATPDSASDNSFATPEQAANVLAFMHWRHERANRSRFFGHVMAQKSLDLVERVGGVELGRLPYKDAAGPNDKPHMTRAEVWARENQFFEFVERAGGGYDFKKLANYGAMLSSAKTALKPIEAELGRVANILVGKDKVQAEIFATVLAAWNNLIIDGKDATEAAILREARDDWHPDKIDLPIAKFQDAIREIRRLALVPDGTAKAVRHKQAALF
nr:restriction endonuclease subunit S [Brevundimonas naejangsanensis]